MSLRAIKTTYRLMAIAFAFAASASVAYAATNIYYSAGQNTSDHKTGSPTITISGSTATFSVAQTAANMGIGDVVNYGGSRVFISGKTSTTVWSVQTATGTTPVATTSAPVTSITHSFSSLKNAVNAYQAGNATSTNFLNTSDLVSGNYVLNIPLYNDAGTAEATNMSIAGYTTGPSNYLRIYTPTSTASEVNQNQRHNGTFNTAVGYALVFNVNGSIISITSPYTRIDGIQIKNTNATRSDIGFSVMTTDDRYISNSIFASANNASNGIDSTSSGLGVGFHYWNNIFIGTGVGIKEANPNYATSTVYNNTFYDTTTGIQPYGNCSFSYKVKFINNVFASTTNPFTVNGCRGIYSGYNSTASTSLGYASGSNYAGNDLVSQTFQFFDAPNGNFALGSSDTAALDLGTSTPASDSYYPFTSDILGATRPSGSAWDRGAFEYTPAPDTTPPGVSGGSPSGQVAYGTTTVAVSVTTNENATCKYDTVSGTAYASMPNTFTTTGGTSHSFNATSLQNGHIYTYYVRCQDSSNNADTSDYSITFQVNQGTNGTVYAQSCSVSDTNTAMGYVNDGDTLSIPAGTCTGYSSTAGLAINKAITVKGAGIDQTILQISSTTPGTYFSGGVIVISAAATLKDLTIQTDTVGNSGTGIVVNSPGFRISNVKYVSQAPSITGYFIGINDGANYGLIDHVDVTANAGTNELVQVHGPTDSWQVSNSLGKSEAVFIEDSTFRTAAQSTFAYVTDCNVNSRCVVRNTTVTGGLKLDGHGYASNGGRGVRQFEAYNNLWSSTYNGSWAAIEMRGGTGMIFNNTALTTQSLGGIFYMTDYGYTATWPNFGVTISSISTGNPTTITTASPHGFVDQQQVTIATSNSTPNVNGTYTATVTGANTFTIPVNVTVAGTTGNATDYQTPYDYPIKDQIGVGKDPKASGSEPFYIWNNIRGGVAWARTLKAIPAAAVSLYNLQIGSTTATYTETSTVQPNKDFFSDSGFDTSTSTVGMTTGTFASIPGTCTTGQGYWATDKGGNWDASNATANDGALYKCASANTWSLYYTPYAYPHYLTAASTTATDQVDIGAGARFFGNGKFYGVSTSTASGAYATIGATTTPIASASATSSTDYWLDLTIQTWSNTGTRHKAWTEASATLNATTTHHMVGDLAANTAYVFTIDGSSAVSNISSSQCSSGTCTSDSSGKIYFDYTGGYSSHTFDLVQSTPDTTAPIISSIASSTTATTATITWTTDEAATSTVAYGLTASYGTASSSSSFVTSHSIGLTGLSSGTTYHFKVSSGDSSYNYATSSDYTFTTASSVSAPSVTTSAASSISGTAATLNGSITATGGANATQSGFAYGTSASLATVIATTTLGAQTGTASFNSPVSSLSCGTTYYARAYATNSAGTGYGTIISFATSACISAPSVTTSAPSSVSTSTLSLNGSISSTGGEDASQSGFAWGTASNLSGGGTATTTLGAQTGTASFSSSLLSLTPNTLYYFRAYATNSGGTSFGSILPTTTLSVSVPTVTTQAASSVAETSATGNGTITVTGNINPTVRGVAYGLTTSYGATTTESGSFSTGAYTASIPSLTCNTSYHFRAYATNSQGTAYGSDQTFTTSACGSTPVTTSSGSSSSRRNRESRDVTVGGSSLTTEFTQTSSSSTTTAQASTTTSSEMPATTISPISVPPTLKSFIELLISLGVIPQEKANAALQIVSVNVVPSFTRDLKQGMRGDDVLSLQKTLSSGGYLKATPNGIFGPATQAALRAYQKAHGIPSTGYFGPLTRASIEK